MIVWYIRRLAIIIFTHIMREEFFNESFITVTGSCRILIVIKF